jgi:hypothetical protein
VNPIPPILTELREWSPITKEDMMSRYLTI